MSPKQSVAVEPVIKEVVLNAPPSKVWRAITNKDDMKKWYFDLEEFKPQKGFEFKFYGGTEQKQYLHICKITEVVPEKKLTYSWRYDGYQGESFVTWELFPEGDKTRLKLTHEGLETFPYDNPDFRRENFAEGWNEIIGTSIGKFLEGPPAVKALEVKRVVNAPIERVWKAFTDPSDLKQWFAPEDMSTPIAEVDLKKGGSLKITMKGKDGEYTAVGKYKTIEPPNKLVFTWLWVGTQEPEMQISVMLKNIETDRTEVILLHENFPDEKSYNEHQKGWESTFNKLSRYF